MDTTTNELKIARTIVGGLVFFAAWTIWNTLGISVFAVSAAAPQASATGFNAGVVLSDVIGPAVMAVLFVVSRTGELVLSFGAKLVGLVESRGSSVDPKKFASASKVSAELKKFEARVEHLEETVTEWEAEGDE